METKPKLEAASGIDERRKSRYIVAKHIRAGARAKSQNRRSNARMCDLDEQYPNLKWPVRFTRWHQTRTRVRQGNLNVGTLGCEILSKPSEIDVCGKIAFEKSGRAASRHKAEDMRATLERSIIKPNYDAPKLPLDKNGKPMVGPDAPKYSEMAREKSGGAKSSTKRNGTSYAELGSPSNPSAAPEFKAI